MKTLIYSNLYIALCAAILTLGTYGYLKVAPEPYLILHVFGVTLMAYNIQRLVRLQKFSNRTNQIRWYLKNKWMLYTSLLIGMMVASWTFLHLPISLLIVFAPLAIISFCYSLPLIPSRHEAKAIRDIPGAKIFLIALVWTGVSWALPMQESGVPWSTAHYLMAIERFVFVLAITIPFDIRDLKYDDGALHTIPQILGYSKAKDFAILLLFVCAVLHAYTDYVIEAKGMYWQLCIIPIFYGLVAAMISRMRADSEDMYFTGLLDGTMLILGLILLFI